VNLFSDGVFAVIITILALELKPPNGHSFGALVPLWSNFAHLFSVSLIPFSTELDRR
jgi:uncharacterized membrane protein